MPSQNGEKAPAAIASIYASADRFTTAGGITTAWFGNLPIEVDESSAGSLRTGAPHLVEAALIDGKWTSSRATVLPSPASPSTTVLARAAAAPTAAKVSAFPPRPAGTGRPSPFPSRASNGSAPARSSAPQPTRAPPASPPPAGTPRRPMISRGQSTEGQPPPATRPPFSLDADDDIIDIPF